MKPEAPKPDYNAGQSHAYGNAGIKPKPNPNVMGPYAIKRPEAKQPRSSALDSYEPNKPHAQQWTPQMEKEHREIWDRLVNGNRSSKTDIIGMNPQSGNDDDRRSAPTKNLNPELQSEAWVYEGADEPEEQADDMLDPTYE